MAAKKKVISAVAAVATSAALLLGGTLAWQSTNQTALNEASDIVNPGGRLHDDFDGENKDVYVENFAEEPIFARVRLEEYFEIVMNKGAGAAEATEIIVGDYDAENDENIYDIHLFTTGDNTNETAGVDENDYGWWNWTMGGETVFMPTFNLNKDSLAADINGTYEGPDGTDGAVEGDDEDRYQDYVDYSDPANASKTAAEIYDGDTNTDDEVGEDFEALDTYAAAGNVVLVEDQTHNVVGTPTAQLISMDEWLSLLNETYGGDYAGNAAELDDYWVYDEDGWVYWSAPIEAGEATGLLLDKIELNQVMDDSWYYAINVVAQFVTADDVGKVDNSGFYDTSKGDLAPSAKAEELLAAIGVDMSGDAPEEDEGGEFVTNAGTLTGINFDLYTEDENISVNEDTNTITINPIHSFSMLDMVLADDAPAAWADMNVAAFVKDADGEYQPHDTMVIVDTYHSTGMVEVYLSEAAAGEYKITADYADPDTGDTWEGYLEFTIDVYESAGDDSGSTELPEVIITEETIDVATQTNVVVYPGNVYYMANNGNEALGTLSDNAPAVLEGNKLTIAGDAGDGETFTGNLMTNEGVGGDITFTVSHDLVFMDEDGNQLTDGSKVLVEKEVYAKWGNTNLPIGISQSASEGDTEDKWSVNEQNNVIIFHAGDESYDLNAFYHYNGEILVSGSAYIDVRWPDDTTATISINDGAEENIPNADDIYIYHVNTTDTVTFTATTVMKDGTPVDLSQTEWKFCVNGNTGIDESYGVGTDEDGYYTGATFTPNLANLEEDVSYCIYVTNPKCNHLYYELRIGEPDIMIEWGIGVSEVIVGETYALKLDDELDTYEFTITAGSEYAEIVDHPEGYTRYALKIKDDAPIGTAITVQTSYEGKTIQHTVTVVPPPYEYEVEDGDTVTWTTDRDAVVTYTSENYYIWDMYLMYQNKDNDEWYECSYDDYDTTEVAVNLYKDASYLADAKALRMATYDWETGEFSTVFTIELASA